MQGISETLEELKLTGLSPEKAEELLKKEGYNQLDKEKRKTSLALIFGIFREPMFLLLLSCGIIYLILGDKAEALMLLAFVIIVIGITIYEENKTENALEALRDLSSPRALVIRDGNSKRIAGKEVVKGDILILAEGDRVPADSIVLAATNFLVDESLLSGESVSVRKTETKNVELEITSPGEENSPFVYSGTLVVSGYAVAMVKQIGMNTQMGKIGKFLKSVSHEKTTLERDTSQIVKNFAIIAVMICVLVVLIYGLTQKQWLQAFLSGITLAMSILPEEFVVILTIFLTLGAWRMSKKNVLTRRQQAIQALGSATILCTDKTGTITQNKMSVKEIFHNHQIYLANSSDFSEVAQTIEYGILASQKEPFDPMEKALKELAQSQLNEKNIYKNRDLVQEYPLSNNLLAVAHAWSSPQGNVVAVKGAPEAIIDLCHLKSNEGSIILKKVSEMSNSGLRVIAVAKSNNFKEIQQNLHDFDFTFLGLVGFQDPIRPTVPQAIKECHSAGIRVMMITGDYPGTAQSISKEIGLQNPEKFITGKEIDNLNDYQLRQKVKEVNIFARVIPEQKLRIVTALKENGEIIIMTGDGVNDAPALKSASIGVAMGERGTDVAREASSIVLVDDNFTSLVQGIKSGRKIFDNIRKAMSYALAIHIPIAGITLLAVILKWPLILLPAHILFLELIINPACSTVFEAEKSEKNIMSRPPRNPNERVLTKKIIIKSIIQGLVIFIAIAFIFHFALSVTHDENKARTLCFTTLIFSNLILIVVNKSSSQPFYISLFEKNLPLWFVIFGAMLFLILTLYLPLFTTLFQFSSLKLTEILLAASVAGISTFWADFFKE